MPRPAVPDFVSEGGRFVVEYEANTGPHDHLICQPRVTDTRAGVVLLDLWGAGTWDWDARVVADTPSTVTLELRRYPGTASCSVVVDADAWTYSLRDAVRRGRLAPLVERLRLARLAEAGTAV